MFTTEQLEEIAREIEAGFTPEEIAQRREMSRSSFVLRLLQSGKRIGTYRKMEDAAPAQDRRELTAA